MRYRIGIDIGGTNTDGVLVDPRLNIVRAYKTPTTPHLVEGVKNVLRSLQVEGTPIDGVFVGTTHATNAILEGKDLYRVGVIRLAGHKPKALDPCFAWNPRIKKKVYVGCETIGGGWHCDSRMISPVRADEVREAAEKLLAQGAEGIALVGVFSTLNGTQELECGEILRDLFGNQLPITLSHKIGGMGIIERENAAILNTALKKALKKGFGELETALDEFGLRCPFWVTQNNGSIIKLSQALDCPLLTVSSGPTNSFMGASKLAGIQEGIVVDIGGTSTDIGVMVSGYPRRSMHASSIGGIPLNFPMPDVYSLAIGGGSEVDLETGEVGPESVGARLVEEALVFGGEQPTLTDIAYQAGHYPISGVTHSLSLDIEQCKGIQRAVVDKIAYGIQLMKGEKVELPVILVGGGAAIAEGIDRHALIPAHSNVANAYGAALAEVSATVDTTLSLENREEALDRVKREALEKALEQGADPSSVRIVDMVIHPYHYVPNHLARVIVSASGKSRFSET